MFRLLKNKVLILSIIAMTLMQSAIINFNIKEKYFNQVKYHVSTTNDVSGYSDPALVQFSSNLLKQPLIALAYAAVGLVIAKLNPKPKMLVLWNVKMFVTIFLAYIGTRFFSCVSKLKNEMDGKLILPYCSWNCGCSLDGPFHPVCLNNETHFSPCWAGCTSFDSSLRVGFSYYFQTQILTVFCRYTKTVPAAQVHQCRQQPVPVMRIPAEYFGLWHKSKSSCLLLCLEQLL